MPEFGPPQGAFDKLRGAFSFLKKDTPKPPPGEITSETLTPEAMERMAEVRRLVKDGEDVVVVRRANGRVLWGQAEGFDPVAQTITISYADLNDHNQETTFAKSVPIEEFMSWQTPEYIAKIVGAPTMERTMRREKESDVVTHNAQVLKHVITSFATSEAYPNFFFEISTGRIMGYEGEAVPADSGRFSQAALTVRQETNQVGETVTKIIDIDFLGSASAQAMEVLQNAVDSYNQGAGFRLKTKPRGRGGK